MPQRWTATRLASALFLSACGGASTSTGPAVITEEVGTTVLLPGDTARVAGDGAIEVTW